MDKARHEPDKRDDGKQVPDFIFSEKLSLPINDAPLKRIQVVFQELIMVLGVQIRHNHIHLPINQLAFTVPEYFRRTHVQSDHSPKSHILSTDRHESRRLICEVVDVVGDFRPVNVHYVKRFYLLKHFLGLVLVMQHFVQVLRV